jgi:hypothetical protein
MPRQYLPQSVTPAPRRENPSVFRRLGICRDMYCPILGGNPDSGVTCTIFSRCHEPLYSMRLPTLKQTNFKQGPIPYRGNVVARVNCSGGYLMITNVIWKPPTPLSSMIISICPKTIFENISVEYILLQGFWKHFRNFLWVFPILEFLAPLDVCQGFAANQQATIVRVKN